MVDVFTGAFRALNLAFFIFREGENHLERFLTIFAVEFVSGHGHLLRTKPAPEL